MDGNFWNSDEYQYIYVNVCMYVKSLLHKQKRKSNTIDIKQNIMNYKMFGNKAGERIA